MITWTAIVPWKQGSDTKSRLSATLDLSQRQALAAAMAQAVITRLSELPSIAAVHLLAPAAVPQWPCLWLRDEGRGLNEELTSARDVLGNGPIIVVHADLPCLTADDVTCLLAAAAASGAAFAPDRHGRGTNAVALADSRPFQFAFGPDSLTHHRHQRADAAIVERAGLGFDVDTPSDIDHYLGMACRKHRA